MIWAIFPIINSFLFFKAFHRYWTCQIMYHTWHFWWTPWSPGSHLRFAGCKPAAKWLILREIFTFERSSGTILEMFRSLTSRPRWNCNSKSKNIWESSPNSQWPSEGATPSSKYKRKQARIFMPCQGFTLNSMKFTDFLQNMSTTPLI